MHGKRVFFAVSSLSFLLLLASLRGHIVTSVNASPDIIVPDDYTTIQEAVYAASPGDTIQVRAGVYYENLNINQSVTILGENNATTIIDGKDVDNVIVLNNVTITISGFTIRNSEHFFGIQADNLGGHTIVDNIISNNAYGIQLFRSSSNTVVGNTFFNNSIMGIEVIQANDNNITNNFISESAYGIKFASSNSSSIVGNTVSDASYGIYTSYSSWNNIANNNVSAKTVGIYPAYSDDNTVSNNTVSGGAYGIELYGSKRNTILDNTLSDNSYGIILVISNTNTIDGNDVLDNDWGIDLYDSDSNTIVHNTISDNTYGIYITSYSSGNSIYHNNFFYNVMQAYQEPTGFNNWDNGLGEGSYWSDYTGADLDGDGVGDTNLPHVAVDWYPLINPWGFVFVHDIAILSVVPSPTEVSIGQVVNITVLVTNEGNATETFNVTTYYNTTATEWTAIETQNITNLAPSTNRTLTFGWNTTNVSPSIYQIKAEASVHPEEVDTADNVYIDGIVTVTSVGDIAVVSVTPADNTVYGGYVVNITVAVANEGTTVETFNVTLKFENTTLGITGTIGTQMVLNLSPGANSTFTFEWNTTEVQTYVSYTIIAEASTVPEEVDTYDNILVDGQIIVRTPGDINGDGSINLYDALLLSIAFGTSLGDPDYVEDADINSDGVIDILDAIIITLNYTG